MRHHITKYRNEEGVLKVVSWIQINIFGKCFCFSKKYLEVENNA